MKVSKMILKRLIGADEVGYGSWIDPICVAAVVGPLDHIKGIRDSKKISDHRRRTLADQIMDQAPYWCIVGSYQTDVFGIMKCKQICFRVAISKCLKLYPGSKVIVDGVDPIRGYTTMIGGDDKIKEIGAASIIAKVYRDRICDDLAEIYPRYGFQRHRGYGTKEHRSALERYGLLWVHRKSFNIK